MSEPSDRFWQLYEDATGLPLDLRAARNLRQRIRRDQTLSDAERAELLERAQYVPGCIPLPVDLVEPGPATRSGL